MKTNTLSTESNEVRAYPQLQHEIHDALRVQHPEWIKPMVLVPPANLTSRDSQNCSVFLHPPNITGSFRSECSTSNFGTAFNLTKLHKPSERRTNVRGDRTFLGAAGFVTASSLDIRHSTLLQSRIRAICGLLRPAAWRLKDSLDYTLTRKRECRPTLRWHRKIPHTRIRRNGIGQRVL
jgi:hypothetical protein